MCVYRQIFVNKIEVIQTNIWTQNGVVHTLSAALSPVLNWCQEYNDQLGIYVGINAKLIRVFLMKFPC